MPADVTTAALLRPLVPDGVAVVESRGNTAEPLFPEEQSAIANAVEKRRREFSIGRQCARRSLGLLGVAPVPLPVGAGRVPVWPACVVGSITHCDGYCAAAAGPAAQFKSIGIDAEVHRPLGECVSGMIASAAERHHLESLPNHGVRWECVLFSAKESVFKAWYPLTRRWLGFHDAEVHLNPAAGTFRARLLVAGATLRHGALVEFEGRFVVLDDLVGTAVVVPASRP
jgi:4'-phosphopantetheinyl transferase EntD